MTVQLTTQGEESKYGNTIASYSGNIVVPKTVEFSGRTFTVTSINPYAFINCSLSSLTIPETVIDVDSNGDNMGLAGTFKKLIIEDGNTPIKCFRALVSCYNGDVTESVYLGRNIEGAQDDNIVYDGGSYKEVTFGEKVTYLNDACPDCNNLTNVILPKNIKKLSGTFFGCANLMSVSGEGVEVAEEAFSGCSKLATIYLPSIKVIDGAFSGCSFTSFVIPQGVVSMSNAFYGCSNLETITIPATMMNIGGDYYYNDTFVGCNALKTIIVGNPTPISLDENNFESLIYLNATLKVPVGAVEAYRNTAGWKNFFNIEEDASITDDIFTLVQSDNYSYGGTVEVSVNEALPAYDKYKFIKKGETLTIKVVPERDYKLSTLLINGTDVTEDVVDNIYQTTINGSISYSASFEYDYDPTPRDPIFLTIQQADNGTTSLQVEEWSKYTLIITPSQGWKIHSVTFNNTDVTTQIDEDGKFTTPYITENSALRVVYELDDIDKVGALSDSGAEILSTPYGARVIGANIGDIIRVYTTDGKFIQSVKVESSSVDILLEKDSIYIIQTGKKTVKLGH